MRNLKDEANNVDNTNPTDYPYTRPKDSQSGANDGTELKENTLATDILYPFYHIMNQANVQPDGTPENINKSQVFEALIKLFGNVGEIVSILGNPTDGSRLLELNGQQVDLSQLKYKYLKEWVIKNKVDYPTLFKNKDTADANTDRWKFKIDINNDNVLILPNAGVNDVLQGYNTAQPDTLGSVTDGETINHSHVVNDFTVTIPAHTHTASQVGHSHGRGDQDISGAIKNLYDPLGKYNEPSGAFSNSNLRVAGPGSGGYNTTADITFYASRAWTGRSTIEQPTITVNNKTAFNTATKTGLTTKPINSNTKNISAGVFIKHYIRY